MDENYVRHLEEALRDAFRSAYRSEPQRSLRAAHHAAVLSGIAPWEHLETADEYAERRLGEVRAEFSGRNET
jgi:broad specificity phosphatase PhoE